MSQNPQNDDYEKVYEKAIKLLALRLHTKAELTRKLLLKNYSRETVVKVINELEERKFLDDESFAEVFLENLIKYKTFGYFMLKAKLLQRGISASLAEDLLQDKFTSEAEYKVARKFADKSKKTGLKLKAALKSRGFRNEVIFKIDSGSED